MSTALFDREKLSDFPVRVAAANQLLAAFWQVTIVPDQAQSPTRESLCPKLATVLFR
jgi:hypothetical protein